MFEFALARPALASLFALLLTASCGGRAAQSHDHSRNGNAGNSTTAGDSGVDGVAASAGSTGGASSGNAGSSGSGASDSVRPQFDCNQVASPQFDAEHMAAYSVSADVSSKVDAALTAMSASEKASQMLGLPIGDMNFQDISRSPDVQTSVGNIRGFRYRNADRGVNLDAGQPNRPSDGKDFSTAFPATSVRAASWDLELEKRVGEAIGDETAASRNNVALAPTVDIIRHPYWGRTQDTYGEDNYHIGRMATAFAVGVQTHVVACAGHFAASNIELRKESLNALMNEQTLREMYGRHFEMVVQDAGVGCVVASYNLVNGVKSTKNRHLLGEILKAPVEQAGFGFRGFVISDLFAMPGDISVQDASTANAETQAAVIAGLDVELPWTLHYSTMTLAQADQALVDDAARRILTQKFRFKSALDTDGWSATSVKSTLNGGSIAPNLEHEALAEEAEIKSAVLLANGAPGAPVLPLTTAAQKMAVLGPDREFELFTSTVPKSCPLIPNTSARYCNFHFATDAALGDRGSDRVNADPERTIGPFQGIKDAAGPSRTVTSGTTADAVPDADTIVVVVGYTPGDEGEEYTVSEGGDRSSLDLPEGQNQFINTVLDRNQPTIIVVNSGSIVNLPWLSHANQNQATIWAGYGGMRVGAALAKLIFGSANFSGKMPLAWPTQAELDQMPFKDSPTQTTMGYFFGYREYDRRKAQGKPVSLVFPFGHGESYSSFAYSNLTVPCQKVSKEAIVKITVDITNTSRVDGDEIAMLFVKPPGTPKGAGPRPVKELKSFTRVSVQAGQTVTAELPLRMRDLRRWEGDAGGQWLLDTGDYTLLVGKNADDAEAGGLHGTLNYQAN